MSTSHTPGPWAWDGEGRIDALQFRKVSPHLVDGKPYMEGLVALPYSCGGHATHEANARLIAAAPELLEAVERALRHAQNIGIDSEGSSYVSTLRTAIAKARGGAK